MTLKKAKTMSSTNSVVSILNLKKLIQEKFPSDSVTREFVLRLPDDIPEHEFMFLAKMLQQLIQIEIERPN